MRVEEEYINVPHTQNERAKTYLNLLNVVEHYNITMNLVSYCKYQIIFIFFFF